MTLRLADDRYLAALERFRDSILAGSKLEYYDDTTPGAKDTQCTWGLCSSSKDLWPDPEDHMWPDHFTEHGRSAPKYREKHQFCPHDEGKDGSMGCFWRCKVFNGKPPTRVEAVNAFNQRIREVTDG